MAILFHYLQFKAPCGTRIRSSYHLLWVHTYLFGFHQTANVSVTGTLQAQNFASKSSVNGVSLYLERARLIDRIRISLRSDSSGSLASILNDPALDSFVVTNALKSAPSPDSALSFIESLKTVPHFSHTRDTLYALAKVLAKSGQTAKLKALINGINSGKFKNVARVSFMDQMKLYAAASDLDSVLCVWHEWRSAQKHPVVEAYNIIMELCVQTGKDYEAGKTFCRMIDDGGVPNSRTYTVMIEHLVKCGNSNLAMEIFKMLPSMRLKRTLRQYSILVGVFCGTDQFDVVKSLLGEMQIDGIMPNRGMHSSLQRMHDAGFIEETSELIKEMLPDQRIKNVKLSANDYGGDDDDDDGNGVKLRPWFDPAILASSLYYWRPEDVSALEDAKFVWTTRLVLKMMRSFSSAESAWQFFSWVDNQPGFSHDVHTMSRMLIKLAHEGHIQLVEQLITKIESEGMQLASNTLRVIIDYYGISKNGQAALKIFRSVKPLCGTLSRRNVLFLYSSLLRTLAKCNMGSKALDMLDEMILSGISPDIRTFSELTHHFALKGDIKTVQRLYGMVKQSGIEPDAYMFKILICNYCKSNRAALALRVFEDMRNSNMMPDASTKRLLVKSLWKEGKLREAATVEETSAETHGHSYTLGSTDLQRVYKCYSSSFTTINGEECLCEVGSADS